MGSGSSPLSCGVFLPPPLLQALPLLIAGRVLLLLLASMFVYSSSGRWVFPLLLWSFPPSATLTSFPAPGWWVHAPTPTFFSQARLVYLQFREGFPSPPSALRAPHPLCYVSLLFLLLIIQFLFFPLVGVGLSRGLCWSGPRMSGSTVYHLAHLVVHVFPSCLGAGYWRWPRGPPGFSIQSEVEVLFAGWRCGGVKVLPLPSGLACKVCLHRLSKISL
jgi:hypothetical protein